MEFASRVFHLNRKLGNEIRTNGSSRQQQQNKARIKKLWFYAMKIVNKSSYAGIHVKICGFFFALLHLNNNNGSDDGPRAQLVINFERIRLTIWCTTKKKKITHSLSFGIEQFTRTEKKAKKKTGVNYNLNVWPEIKAKSSIRSVRDEANERTKHYIQFWCWWNLHVFFSLSFLVCLPCVLSAIGPWLRM